MIDKLNTYVVVWRRERDLAMMAAMDGDGEMADWVSASERWDGTFTNTNCQVSADMQ